jgi:short-subunit dehydrogenase
VITGASRGIGVYLARALGNQGMNLVLAARSTDALAEVCQTLTRSGVRALPVRTDLANRVSLIELVGTAIQTFGRIDVLVNNAGIDQCEYYARLDPAFIDEVIQVNLTAPMQLTRLVLPGMIERGEGHVVNIASLAGLAGTPYNETYSATKHGLLGFTRSLRLTMAAEGHPIGVSAICPGFVSDAGMFQTMVEETNVRVPFALGLSKPQAVAEAMLRAIYEDTPETIVNSRPIRPLLLAATLLPRFGEYLSRVLGVVRTYKHVAERQHRRAKTSATGDNAKT